jgi:hypothetical protein
VRLRTLQETQNQEAAYYVEQQMNKLQQGIDKLQAQNSQQTKNQNEVNNSAQNAFGRKREPEPHRQHL